MLNDVKIIANLGRDAEHKFAQSGLDILNLNVAISERFKQGEEWKSKTSWVTVTAFGNTAKYNAELKKGARVLIQGKLDENTWEDQEGNKKSKLVVIANSIKSLDKKEKVESKEESEDMPF